MLSFFLEPSVRVAAFFRGAALGRDASKETAGSSLSVCKENKRGMRGEKER
jgi:hypothetical protein